MYFEINYKINKTEKAKNNGDFSHNSDLSIEKSTFIITMGIYCAGASGDDETRHRVKISIIYSRALLLY